MIKNELAKTAKATIVMRVFSRYLRIYKRLIASLVLWYYLYRAILCSDSFYPQLWKFS